MTTNIDPLLVVILGPTGSGKTELGVRLAERFGTCILSADSRQIYRGMAIGTAQPDAGQLARVRHYFIATHDPGQEYTCGTYEEEALALLGELFRERRVVFAVGGSGLYIDALCRGLDRLPRPLPGLRDELTRRLHDEGIGALTEELRRLDPVYYEQVDRSNPARVMRALEVCISAGRPYSELRSGQSKRRDFEVLRIGLDLPREELYARIDRRVEQMVAAGLEAEARALFPLRGCNALRTVGYREWFDCFDGRITRDEAIEAIKRNTRRYAKRQLTWFRRDAGIHWFTPSDEELVATLISGRLKRAE